jgi:hypothetical protein
MTMGALNETTLTKVLEELRAQRWTLNPSPSGDKWRAEPPDPKRKVVTFTARPAVLLPILRQLRDQGFRWPPGEPKQEEPPSIVRSVPFPPKAHPDVQTDSWVTTEPLTGSHDHTPPGKLVLVKATAPSGTADQAFERLKEAREYALLAAEDLASAKSVLDQAKAVYDGAHAVYDDAIKQLASCKSDFDALFNRPGDP